MANVNKVGTTVRVSDTGEVGVVVPTAPRLLPDEVNVMYLSGSVQTIAAHRLIVEHEPQP